MHKPIAVLIAVLGQPALAADDSVAREARLRACAAIADAAARLECFDRNATAPVAPPPAAAARPPPAPAAATSPPAVAPAPAPARAADAPSRALGDEQLTGRSRADPADQEPALRARIAEARRGGQGTYLVILDNGQVWRHEEGSMAEFLKAGEAVTIRKGGLGSYRLTLDAGRAKNWVRVTRIR